jgi:hypothetical protein
MTNIYGIKIAKPGKSVHSTDMRDLSLDLNRFSMFKLHSSGLASVTLNAGDTEASATVTHGLGYVPAFLVYYKRSDESVERLIPDIPYGVDFDFWPWAYATSSNIVVGYSCKNQYNRINYNLSTVYNNSGSNGFAWIGNSSGNARDSGIQYKNIALSKDQSIDSASIDFKASDTGSGTQNIKMNIWGIDVDNLGDFGSDLGLSRTTATHSQEQSALNDGDHFGITVTNELREIIGRNNWVNGNNLGFYIFDNGTSSTGNNYVASYPDNLVVLSIIKTGSLTISFRVVIFKDRIL